MLVGHAGGMSGEMLPCSNGSEGVANLSRLGRLQSALLSGAWRACPDSPALTPGELAEISSLLLESGAGGLGWWSIRRSNLASTPAGKAFREAYRFHALQAALKEEESRQAITTIRDAGVEPLLLKGWAVARSYPQRGLRPYGDIDLLVRSESFDLATWALTSSPRLNTTVELHPGLGGLAESNTAQLFDRSRVDDMDAFQVRVLSSEDQLRYLCLHFIKHGARRPLFLADIGLLLEAAPSSFDWDYCLRGSGYQVDWIACILKLANTLLGARLDAVPTYIQNRVLPDWLGADVLRQWEYGMRRYNMNYVEHYLRTPGEICRAVRDRWPNGVEATQWSGAPINVLPRFPLQLLQFVYGAAVFPVSAFVRFVQGLSRKASSTQGEATAVRVTGAHTALYAAHPWDSP
jgi:hypothetical protein